MTGYKSLEKIVAQIAFDIDQLNSGKLSAIDIDELLTEVNQLQERLIILRYKAYEATADLSDAIDLSEGNLEESPAMVEESVEDERPVISFTTNTSSTNPVSLKEVIHEALQREPEHSNDLNEALQKAKAFPTIETETQNIALAKESTDLFGVVEQVVPVVAPQPVNAEGNLGQRLHKTPITDLTKAIPLGSKFSFISILFKGNSEEYNQSIEKINSSASKTDAFIFIETELISKHKWNKEDKNVEQFLDLVERRFMQ